MDIAFTQVTAEVTFFGNSFRLQEWSEISSH
jgi:hypothetical protein